MPSSKNNLTGLLECLCQGVDGNDVTLGGVIKEFEGRGFGPLLLMSALLVAVLGFIPGVPAIGGIIIIFTSLQMIAGKEYPWMPERLAQFKIPGKKFKKLLERLKPQAKKIDRYVYPRLEFFVSTLSKRIIAVLTLLLGGFTVFTGFIPGVPVLAMIPVLLFALGFSVRDGLLVLSGLGVFTAIIMFAPGLIPSAQPS